MNQEMNQQLEEARQGIFRYNKLNSTLEALHVQQKELQERVSTLKKAMDEEMEDVERLEQQGIVSLFYTVLGKLGERVDKEQQEALAARLKYEQASGELEQLNGQIEIAEKERRQYRDCQKMYDDLFEKKKEHMLNSHSQTGEEIMMLQEQLRISDNNRKELEEAISAGKDVLRHIEEALNSLNSAEGWGTWDLLGGGLLTDVMKHSHIDDAKEQAKQIQRKLSRFRTELADVRIQNEIHFETDGFGKFADFFFDGLIADWCMQSRISESAESIKAVKGQVNTVMHKLEGMTRTEAARYGELQRRMTELIIQA
ncbi:hypothetical protein HNQ56_004084 [Anaerotaenia torta]|uniref:hypothetical protein n=1 Tax=Anaerotaenia torta TaxID=433293 RepID=UPI003D20FB53